MLLYARHVIINFCAAIIRKHIYRHHSSSTIWFRPDVSSDIRQNLVLAIRCIPSCVLCSYEKSNTHRFEVPRMLFDDPEQLGRYIVDSNDA